MLILPFLGPMIIFIVACLFKGVLSHHAPRAHDFIFRTYTAREYRDLHLKKRFTVQGSWEKADEGTLFIDATTAARAMLIANDEDHTFWGSFRAQTSSLTREGEEESHR